MKSRHIGSKRVSAIGLGAMQLTMDTSPTESEAVATVHAALDAGVTLIDTADAYTPSDRGPGMNEEVVAKALSTYGGSTDEVLVATKGGHTRDGSDWGLNGRPDYLRRACEESLRRFGVDSISLYQHHRPDPDVPYEETMGGLRELLDAGLIERAGISNADPDQIRLAREIVGEGLVSVQNQFSPSFRTSEPEIAVCAELGLAFLPWGPLGSSSSAKDIGSSYSAFADVADAHGVSPQQVCLAWELSVSPCVIPIPGASRPATIADSAAAADLELSADEVALLSEHADSPG